MAGWQVASLAVSKHLVCALLFLPHTHTLSLSSPLFHFAHFNASFLPLTLHLCFFFVPLITHSLRPISSEIPISSSLLNLLSFSCFSSSNPPPFCFHSRECKSCWNNQTCKSIENSPSHLSFPDLVRVNYRFYLRKDF
ncbi:hypothetical protein SDJN03_05801, partial [Cucurbita argyrosperma subsp. sororia]